MIKNILAIAAVSTMLATSGQALAAVHTGTDGAAVVSSTGAPDGMIELARRGRGADDPAGDKRRGRGADDPVGHT